jgi:50S ribosomal protein L16 3-hydroxylase
MAGHRNWRISTQKDHSLKEGLPLKILKNFKPTQDWILEPGDMLYLPPNIAHDGIAVDAGCQTWSVGFKAPNYKDLISEILWRTTEVLENDPELNQLYADPKQLAIQDSALVPAALVQAIHQKINQIHWSPSDISCTLASILSEPKPQTVFTPPHPLLDLHAFRKALTSNGISLSPLSKILHDQEFMYLNGESVSDNEEEDWELWKKISINQHLTKEETRPLLRLIDSSENPWFEAYCAGWISLV